MKYLQIIIICAFNLLAFSVYAQDPFENNDTYSTAYQASCDNFYDGFIQDVGDVDWYEVEVTEPGVLKANLIVVPGNLDLHLEIHQLDNFLPVLIDEDDEANASGGELVFAAAFITPGTYLVSVRDEGDNASNINEPYRLTLTCTVDESEINHSLAQAYPVPLDTCFEAQLFGENQTFFNSNEGDNDQDWYRVAVTEPGVLQAVLNSVPSNLDLDIAIYQEGQFMPEIISYDNESNASGGESVWTEAVVAPGEYFIRIIDENFNSTNEESYTLCVSFDVDLLELNQTIELAKPLPLDTCFESSIFGQNQLFYNSNEGAYDQDWYELTLTESGVLRASVTSVPTNLDLLVELYEMGPNQPVLITEGDDVSPSGGQDITSVAYLNAGTYFIHIEDENNNATNQETFTLCIDFFANQFEINQTIDLAAAIPLDTCFEDNIFGYNYNYFDSNEGDLDQDWFEIQVTNPCPLKVQVTDVPALQDLNLELYQVSNGQPVLLEDDGDGNAGGGQALSLEYAAVTGTYFIHLEDENFNRSSEESYSICISCSTISTGNAEADQLLVYPNPGNGLLTVEGLNTDCPYTVSDLSGRQLFRGDIPANGSPLDLQALAPGAYILRFLTKYGVINRRIIIQ